jgi:parallel beta-helix repeat protein
MRNFRRIFVFLLVAAAWPQAGLGSNFYQGVSTNSLYWPGGIIPYKFDTNVTPAEQTIYLDGMREWGLAANVHFVPYSNQVDYVLLRFDYAQGTDTFVLSPPESVLTVDTLSRAQVGHETGHLLGFQHEHVRTDRNSFIVVNFTNLIGNGSDSGTNGSGEGSSVSNLYVIDTNSTLHGAYDFESVMHYGRTLFSTDPDTLDTIDPIGTNYAKYYYRIGNYALSPGDRAGAAFLYGAPTNALTNVVTNTLDVGLGTLRAALYYANDHPGTTVRFNISTNDPNYSNGVYTIYLTGELPPLIANGTVIDGTTQPGYTNRPVIALSGSQLNPELAYPGTLFTCGLRMYAANCTIDGLSIHDFPFLGIAVEYAYAVSNRIEGCYIGVKPDGTAAGNNYQGISIDTGASRNIVGGTNINVISGNAQYGVTIIGTNGQFGATQIGTNTVGNAVQNSWVGLDPTGTHAVSNLLGGIWVFNSANTVTVGGTNAGAGNVISGNGSAGVYLLGVSNNVVQGNFIGLNAAGTAAVPNADSGVYAVGGSSSNLIGGTTPAARNIISGNVNYGIYVSDAGTRNILVEGNYLGTDPTGTTAIGNGFSGIGVWNTATNVVVGGASAGAGNLISGNDDGVDIGGAGTTGVQVFGNYIGTASNGLTALPNSNIGVYLEQGTQSNSIGGTLAGQGNLISGNGTDGGQFYDAGTSFNTIQGNLIGTTKTGLAPLGNNGAGVSMFFGTGNTIGGTTAAARNVICANTNEAVYLYVADNETIQGNYLGVGADGATPMGNGLVPGHTQAGMYVEFSGGNLIGGTTAGAGNIIAGNGNDGIQIYGQGADFNVVQGNDIGTKAGGLIADGNGASGVSVLYGAVSNTIGGATSTARNVISGNFADGVYLAGTSNNIVEGNYIGTDSTGLTGLGNGFEGIVLFDASVSNQIGGATAGQGNVIGNNTYHGIYLSDAGTAGNVIQGNNIGVGANGTTAMGNGFQGILLQGGASGNAIGLALNGSGAGNIIADNTYEGVIVSDAVTVGNTIRGNSIFSNGDLGINLVGGTEILDGVTLNHPGGPVPGPNDLQNYPVLTTTSVASGVTTIYGTLNSAPNHRYLVDVYRNTTPDSSGYGEGQVYLGSAVLNTDGGGNGFFAFSAPGNFAGQSISATATDASSGDTSEFAQDAAATNGVAPFVLFGPYSWNITSGFTLNLALPTNQNYTIQATTNLAAKPIVWTTLSNFVSTNLNTQFVDRSATNHAIPMRFYRIVSP